MQLGTLPEEVAGDSERRCVLSIVERGDGLVHQGIRYFTGLRVFMFLLCT
jgi:hypothetical protein